MLEFLCSNTPSLNNLRQAISSISYARVSIWSNKPLLSNSWWQVFDITEPGNMCIVQSKYFFIPFLNRFTEFKFLSHGSNKIQATGLRK